VSIVDAGRFIADGYVKLDEAAPPAVADLARAALWRQAGLSPDDPGGWREPVAWVSDLTGEGPFGQIIGSPRLAAALDELCGQEAGQRAWVPRGTLGNIPVRFPVLPAADDRGWHIDANATLPGGGYGCGLRSATMLVLTLLSEVGPDDAPTRIRAGSQRDAAAVLGDQVLDPFAAGPLLDAASAHRPVCLATGRPGDMYLVHPLTVHAADEHHGRQPRFMAQTPVFLTAPLAPGGDSPLARAIG
jgi:hypothetical protein